MSSSTGSSVRSSPVGSACSDTEEENLGYVQRPVRRSRVKKSSHYDYNEYEQTVHKAQQDALEFSNDFQQFRCANQIHTRRIQDMMSQFDDARTRLDRLLQRTSNPYDADRSLRYSSTLSPRSYLQRSSMDMGRIGNGGGGSGDSSPRGGVHKSELTVNPAVPNSTKFEAVSLTVRVDD